MPHGSDATPRAVVLVSGGLDSAATLAIAHQEADPCWALTIDYGQRHAAELDAARAVASQIGAARHLMLPLDLRAVGGSALTDDIEVPKAAAIGDEIPITYVPARNMIFLSLAVALAEAGGARAIYLGVNAIDYSGYPDCRPEFIDAFRTAADLGTRAGIQGRGFQIRTPLIGLTKAEIIRRGVDLGVDFSLTRSCYDPDSAGRACGQCDSCRIRRRGFKEAGVADPTVYAPAAGG